MEGQQQSDSLENQFDAYSVDLVKTGSQKYCPAIPQQSHVTTTTLESFENLLAKGSSNSKRQTNDKGRAHALQNAKSRYYCEELKHNNKESK